MKQQKLVSAALLAGILLTQPLLAANNADMVKLGHNQRQLNVPHSFNQMQADGIENALPIAIQNPHCPKGTGEHRDGPQSPVIFQIVPEYEPDK